MRKANRRNTDIFSLAFLDIIACGFGAIVLLLLIVKPDSPSSMTESINFQELFSLQDKRDSLSNELTKLDQIEEELQQSLNSRKSIQDKSVKTLISLKQQVSILADIKEKLNISQQSLTEEMERILNSQIRDEEVGGIPVDSEYVIFVIDNSGSMQQPWKILLQEMQNILDIHPEIKGIQVMNDQGAYLFEGYAGKNKWAPDTASTRKGIMNKLKVRSNWRAVSLSNPVNGIKTAINNHFIPGRKISIYLLGDDLMNAGVIVDKTIEEIDKINTDAFSGEKKARIHGIVFAGQANENLIDYANFIRQVTHRNDGTALFIPISDHPGWVDCSGADCNFISD
ncbi:MAG: hypothetical protein CMD68_02540 [Gammaproteobacteria bacterium]|nr:hypothetical protein [Gammaproteobacteria bacterium]